MMASETDHSQEKLPAYTDHGGFLFPKGFPVEGFRSGLNYQAQGERREKTVKANCSLLVGQ